LYGGDATDIYTTLFCKHVVTMATSYMVIDGCIYTHVINGSLMKKKNRDYNNLKETCQAFHTHLLSLYNVTQEL
jgi:hypothetical protein